MEKGPKSGFPAGVCRAQAMTEGWLSAQLHGRRERPWVLPPARPPRVLAEAPQAIGHPLQRPLGSRHRIRAHYDMGCFHFFKFIFYCFWLEEQTIRGICVAGKKARLLESNTCPLRSRTRLVFTEGLQGEMGPFVCRLRFACRTSRVWSFSGVTAEKSGRISHMNVSGEGGTWQWRLH